MPETEKTAVAVVGIDIGKNSFHVVGLNQHGAIVVRQRWSRGQVESRFANMPPCLIGMEACVGAHHLGRRLKALGHDARLMPAKYVRPALSREVAVECSRGVVSADAADLVCPSPISPAVIQHAVWVYLRFTLSYRDVEDLLAERGLDVRGRLAGSRSH
jgi:hypothetical protein